MTAVPEMFSVHDNSQEAEIEAENEHCRQEMPVSTMMMMMIIFGKYFSSLVSCDCDK
jgi:hypothetical protein